MSPQDVEALKAKLSECGAGAGKEKGEAAGREAGANIDIPHILQEALAAATKAAEQVNRERELGLCHLLKPPTGGCHGQSFWRSC